MEEFITTTILGEEVLWKRLKAKKNGKLVIIEGVTYGLPPAMHAGTHGLFELAEDFNSYATTQAFECRQVAEDLYEIKVVLRPQERK